MKRNVNRSNNYSCQDPFEIEQLRDKLARESNFKKLEKTYHHKFSEINDLNTESLWNKLNKTQDKEVNENNPMVRNRLRFIKNNIGGKNIKILNVGVGTANLERVYFSEMRDPFEWTGVDIAGKSIKIAQKQFPLGKFKRQNILNLNLKDNYYDYVICSEVLEHIPPSKTLKALSGLFRILKPNGKLLISVPLNEGLKDMLKRRYNPNAHVRVYTPDLIKAELNLIHLTVIKEKLLFAFNKNYRIKSLIVDYLFKNFRKPNNIILIAQK